MTFASLAAEPVRSDPAPAAALAEVQPVAPVVEELRRRGFLALTAAGTSTDSGIPVYRGPTSVSGVATTYQEFAT